MTWWHLLLAALSGGVIGWTLDRLMFRGWLDRELDRALEQLQRREQLEQQPDELGRRIRDRGAVDGELVWLITATGVLIVVLLVQLGVRAGVL